MAASLPENVDVHDAGDKLMLSSQDEATLKRVVEEMRKGARGIQAPVKVGSKWVASLEHPAMAQCTVEKIGFEIVITGPTEASVLARSGESRMWVMVPADGLTAFLRNCRVSYEITTWTRKPRSRRSSPARPGSCSSGACAPPA